jgi:hypothetical protein
MHRDTGPFAMSNKIKLLLTKTELEIAGGCSPDKIKLHSPHRLKQYVKLVRKLRDEYRDLNQRQKSALKNSQQNSQSFRTIEKAKVFDKVLSAFEQQSKKVKSKTTVNKSQKKLDHEQHYDLDGVTRVDGKVVIPSDYQVKRKTVAPQTESYQK